MRYSLQFIVILVFFCFETQIILAQHKVATSFSTSNMNVQAGLPSSTPTWISNVNDTVFFQAFFSGGQELWSANNLLEFSLGKFNITASGGQIFAGSTGSLPEYIAQLGQKAYFFANDDYSPGNRQRVLYVSDRTNAGTDSVRNIFPGNSSQGKYLTRAGNKLFFSAQSSVSNEELWQSDGTYAGTTQYPDLNTNARGSFPENLTEVIIGGEAYLFFTADDSPISATGTAGGNRELWRVRVSSGTLTKFEINTTAGSNPKYLTNFNNACYFIANDGTGDKLYQCNDGTTFSVIALGSATINSGGTAPDYILTNPPNYLTKKMAVSGGKLFFSATLSSDEELWVYDGTNPAGRVKDINTAGSSTPGNFTNMNGILYFSAEGATGRELYRSDGTDAGTFIVSDLIAGATSSNPTWLTDVNGILYFFADNPTNTAQKNLWFHNPNTCIPNAEQTKIFYSFQFSGATNFQTSVQASWQITEVSDDFYFSADGINGFGQEPWFVQECPKPSVNYGTNNVICDDGSTSSPTVTFTQSFVPTNICPSGNCFSSSNAALIIDPSTGVIDLSTTPSGIYPITYRYNGTVPALVTGSYAGNCDVYFCFNLEIKAGPCFQSNPADVRGVFFDGIDDRIEVNNTALTTGISSFTYELWVKTLELKSGSSHQIIGHTNGRGIYINGTEQQICFFIDINGGIRKEVCQVFPITLKKWTHIATTFDNATNTLKLYVDGELVASDTFTGTVDGLSSPILQIGNGLNAFSGEIDEIRIFNTVRSLSEITNDISSTTANGALAFWRFETGTGQVIVDETGANNTVLGSNASSETIDPLWALRVVNTNDAGLGSLRQSIIDANLLPGLNYIDFSIPASDGGFNPLNGGFWQIQPSTELPTIVEGLILDCYSQAGSQTNTLTEGNNAILKISLRCSSTTVDGINVESNTEIKGLSIGNCGNGIKLRGDNNKLIGCFVGTDIMGQAKLSNLNGINLIGDSTLITDNVISGNIGNGINIIPFIETINGLTSNNNIISKNIIGLDKLGSVNLGNGGAGITINSDLDSQDNVISENVISGNDGSAIFLSIGSGDIIISKNIIGLDKSGSVAIGNRGGITITNAGNINITENIISGNNFSGIFITDEFSGISNIVISKNIIGLDKTGSVDLGNEGNGIEIIGDFSTITENVVSGNNGSGIIFNSFYIDDIPIIFSSNNLISKNIIGLDKTGSVDLGNEGNGIEIFGNSNTVTENVVSGNGFNGIRIGFGQQEVFNNLISKNIIGLDKTGSVDLGNEDGGIYNLGDSTLITENVISGNGVTISSYGIFSFGNDATISKNIIGLDKTGSVDLGNEGAGIEIYGNTILITENVISGNERLGITGQFNNSTISKNIIGLDKSGLVTLGNEGAGINIYDGGNNLISDNVISGNDGGIYINGTNYLIQGNTVSNNFLSGMDISGHSITIKKNTVSGSVNSGIYVRSDNSNPNLIIENVISENGIGVEFDDFNSFAKISSNSIFCNVGKGIDLSGGANDNKMPPVITNCSPSKVKGTCQVSDSVEVFLDNPICGNPNQGRTFLGKAAVSGTNWTFDYAFNNGDRITATATDTSGNTSEFSDAFVACILQTPPTVKDEFICTNGITTLNATGAITGQVYVWYELGTNNILKTSVDHIDSTFITPSLTTNLQFEVAIFNISTNCESPRDTVDVQVLSPQQAANVEEILPLCGLTVDLAASTTPINIEDGQWSVIPTSGVVFSNATNQNTNVSVPESGIYKFYWEAGVGTCTAIDSIEVDFSTPIVGASILPAEQTINLSKTTTITASVISPSNVTYTWSVISGTSNSISSTNVATPTFNPTEDTEYQVIIRSGNSCADTLTARILIQKENSVLLPNLFTPNGDNKNDVLLLAGLGIEKVSMRVYDRGGTIIFETDDLATATQVGWDGGNHPNGVYVCVVKAKFFDGTEKTLNAKINLMR